MSVQHWKAGIVEDGCQEEQGGDGIHICAAPIPVPTAAPLKHMNHEKDCWLEYTCLHTCHVHAYTQLCMHVYMHACTHVDNHIYTHHIDTCVKNICMSACVYRVDANVDAMCTDADKRRDSATTVVRRVCAAARATSPTATSHGR